MLTDAELEAIRERVRVGAVLYEADSRGLLAERDAALAQNKVLREALPTYPWGENDECYSCGGGEPEHWDGCNWVTARARCGRGDDFDE